MFADRFCFCGGRATYKGDGKPIEEIDAKLPKIPRGLLKGITSLFGSKRVETVELVELTEEEKEESIINKELESIRSADKIKRSTFGDPIPSANK